MAQSDASTELAVSEQAAAGLPATVADGATLSADSAALGSDDAAGKSGRWSFLSNADVLRQIALIIGLAIALLIAILVVIWTQEPDYRPLGELPTDELIQTLDFLDTQKIVYKLEGNRISVPVKQYQQIKLDLARAGLVKQPTDGSDLLMQDMGFGVSQRLESERLKLAREQMLARTIEDLNPVATARVLLALPRTSVFANRVQKPGATVVVTLRRGYTLRQEEIDSVVDIVASAVTGMDPSRVTVTDQNGRLLHSGSQDPMSSRNRREYELQRQREAEYLEKIDAILIPVLGIGNYTAQVDVNMDFTQVEQTQRRFDPQSAAVRSEMVLEQRSQGQQNSGIPGALSNQPPATANIPQVANGPGGAGAQGPSSSTTEATRNFEVDTTVSHTRQQSGVIRRLSVSVAVDYQMAAAEDGSSVAAPRTAQQLANIQRLLQGGLGFDVQRGDTLEVVSVPFVKEPLGEAGPEPPIWQDPWIISLARVLAGALVVIVLVLTVIRPMVRKLLNPVADESLVAYEGGEGAEGAMAGAAAGGAAGTVGGMAGGMGGFTEEERALLGDSTADGSDLFGGPGIPNLNTEDELIEAVRAIVASEPGVAARVLKTWMTEDA